VQAELRLAVVTAIDEKERQRGIHGAHPGWQALHGDRDARLVLGLIAEALAVYKLTSTRACLLAESGMVRYLALALRMRLQRCAVRSSRIPCLCLP